MASRPSPALANAVAPGVRVEHIEPLQTRIERNRLKFVGFMIAFVTAFALSFALLVTVAAALVLAFTLDWGFIWSTVRPVAIGSFLLGIAISTAWACVRLARSETALLARLGAQMPSGGTLLATKSALRDMAIAAGLPETPRFYVIDTPGTNAFVLGRSLDKLRIGVTRGMLEKISVDEQRAVFANLIARALAADTLWATAVSAIMGPVWAIRDHGLRRDDRVEQGLHDSAAGLGASAGDWRLGVLIVYGLLVVVTEVFAWYHQEAAWRAAEKADAEGMMLLKDPRSMLSAIEHVLDRHNHVPSAGEAYSLLFFCWAGFGFGPEDDPEMRRVARLRETLGAEGAAYVPRPNVPGWPLPLRAPRLEFPETGTGDQE